MPARQHRRTLPADVGTFMPVPSINRNLAVFDSLILDTSADASPYALDANA